jgi:hypothetical protein
MATGSSAAATRRARGRRLWDVIALREGAVEQRVRTS